MSVYHLSEGLKTLRSVGAKFELREFNAKVELWRDFWSQRGVAYAPNPAGPNLVITGAAGGLPASEFAVPAACAPAKPCKSQHPCDFGP